MDPLEQSPSVLQALWDYRLPILVVTVLAAMAGYGLSQLLPTTYEATAEVVLQEPSDAGVLGGRSTPSRDPERHIRNQAERMTSGDVITAAADILGPDASEPALRRSLSVKAVTEQDLITVTATAPEADPDLAARRSNAVVEAYEVVAERDVQEEALAASAELEKSRLALQAEVDALASRLAAAPDDTAVQAQMAALQQQRLVLQTRSHELAVNAALFGSGIQYTEPAATPERPASPKPTQNAALGGLLGLAAAAAVAWRRAGASDRFDDSEDPGGVLGVPMLGQVPDFQRPLRQRILRPGRRGALSNDPVVGEAAGEAYHFVVTSLDFVVAGAGPVAVVFTSSAPGEGKTSAVVNTAVAATANGRRVLAVDADCRQRGLTRWLGLDGAAGLSDFVLGDLPLEECVHTVELGPDRRLTVMPSGTPVEQPVQFLRLPEVAKAILQMKELADLVLLDTAPVLPVADTAVLAGEADAVVVVVKRGTAVADLEVLRDRLSLANTPFLGYVFNRAKVRDLPYAHYRKVVGRSGT